MSKTVSNDGKTSDVIGRLSKLMFPFLSTNREEREEAWREFCPLPRQPKRSDVLTQTENESDEVDQPEKAEEKENNCSWIIPFLSATTYFEDCQKHFTDRNGKLSFFCRECPAAGPLCKNCIVEEHSDHKVLKVSKNFRHEVLRGPESHCFDTSDVYPYMASGESAYFLRSDRPLNGANKCIVCNKILSGRKLKVGKRMKAKEKLAVVRLEKQRKSAQYCSLSCKLQDLANKGIPVRSLLKIKSSVDDAMDMEDDEKELMGMAFDEEEKPVKKLKRRAPQKARKPKGGKQKRRRRGKEEDTEVEEDYLEEGDSEDDWSQEEQEEMDVKEDIVKVKEEKNDSNGNSRKKELGKTVAEGKQAETNHWQPMSLSTVDEKPGMIEMNFSTPKQSSEENTNDEESHGSSKRLKSDVKSTSTQLKEMIEDNMDRLNKILDASSKFYG